MNAVRLFSLGATAAAKDYLRGRISAKFQPSRSKSNPARPSYRVYDHAVYK